MASQVSNEQVTTNRPSQQSRCVSHHHGSCALFRSQIRSQPEASIVPATGRRRVSSVSPDRMHPARLGTLMGNRAPRARCRRSRPCELSTASGTRSTVPVVACDVSTGPVAAHPDGGYVFDGIARGRVLTQTRHILVLTCSGER